MLLSLSLPVLIADPINLVRTRLQTAGMGGNRSLGPIEVIRHTLESDGPRGFYRGLLPNMLKVLPATGISYTVFSIVSERVK